MQTELKVQLKHIFTQMAFDPVLKDLRRNKSGDVDTRQKMTPEQRECLAGYREKMNLARRGTPGKFYRATRDRLGA